jgi:hypothetical protein
MLTLPLVFVLCAPNADELIKKTLDTDPLGLFDAVVSARIIIKDKKGASSTLSLTSSSKRYDGQLSKSLVRFSAPADLAGAGFLQVQKKQGDDDRFLFLPELKKSRRIGGNLRSNAFMGTDFSYADIDNRDLRESKATLIDEPMIGKVATYHLMVTPNHAEALYGKIELWVRKDDFIVIRQVSFDKANVMLKTLEIKELKKLGKNTYVTRCMMTNHVDSHTSEYFLDKVNASTGLDDGEFTTRNLEKI